jgi:hypothetical protein
MVGKRVGIGSRTIGSLVVVSVGLGIETVEMAFVCNNKVGVGVLAELALHPIPTPIVRIDIRRMENDFRFMKFTFSLCRWHQKN